MHYSYLHDILKGLVTIIASHNHLYNPNGLGTHLLWNTTHFRYTSQSVCTYKSLQDDTGLIPKLVEQNLY